MTSAPARLAPIAALLLAACGTTEVTCPDEVQGTLTFRARPVATNGNCGWFNKLITDGLAVDLTFTATVSFQDDVTAVLCLQRTLSQEKKGPRSGDTFSVSSTAPAAAGAVGTCPCPVLVEETFSATLVRAADGRVNGYRDGSLVAHLTRPADADPTCYADTAGPAGECPAPTGCDLTYVAPPP